MRSVPGVFHVAGRGVQSRGPDSKLDQVELSDEDRPGRAKFFGDP